jgi:hypothetical protein
MVDEMRRRDTRDAAPGGPVSGRAAVRRAFPALGLCLALIGALVTPRAQAAAPLAVRISGFEVVAPGQMRADVTVNGWEPPLGATMTARVTVNGAPASGRAFPVTAAHVPMIIDLPAGRVRVGGDASVLEFQPVPRPDDDLPVELDVNVRQGDGTAAARQTGVLLLPVVIVPGYMNDMGGPDAGALAVLEAHGYRVTGPSPSVFWFAYPSRSLDLEAAARALDAYVSRTVLPRTYAARLNVVGFSLGGLIARWNLAFKPGWDRLTRRFVMVGVPNEGVVMPYVYGWYPLTAGLARTAAARNLLPTFPFWRPTPGAAWSVPAGAQNREMQILNAHPLPPGLPTYDMYGNRPVDGDGHGTWAGVTGEMSRAQFSCGPGDGIVLTASALGLPINGGGGIPGFAERLIRADLGPIGHLSLLAAAMPRIIDVFGGGVSAQWRGGRADETRAPHRPGGPRIGLSPEDLTWLGTR